MNAYKLLSPSGMEIGSACGVCHQIAAPGNYDISEKCCTCYECGKPLSDKDRRSRSLYHDACDKQMRVRWQQERLDKAKLVNDYDGPVYLEGIGRGSYGDGYFSDVHELAESIPTAVETDGTRFAFCCESRNTSLDFDSIIENLAEEMFEDAADSLNGLDELREAIDAFNLANESVITWDVDYERKVAIPSTITREATDVR